MNSEPIKSKQNSAYKGLNRSKRLSTEVHELFGKILKPQNTNRILHKIPLKVMEVFYDIKSVQSNADPPTTAMQPYHIDVHNDQQFIILLYVNICNQPFCSIRRTTMESKVFSIMLPAIIPLNKLN